MPQLPTDGSLDIFFALLAAMLAVLTIFFWLRFLQELRLRRRVQKYLIALQNTGNTATPYELRLSEPSEQLGFTLLTTNALLEEQVRTAPRGRSGPVAPKADGPSKLGALREVGMMGSSLGSLLPAPIAKPIQAMTAGVMKAVNTTLQVQRVQKSAEKVAKQGQALSGAAGGMPTKAGTAQGTVAAAPTVEEDIVDRWYETPLLTPGQEVALTLEVDWRAAVPPTRYPFRLSSQPQGAGPDQPDIVLTDGLLDSNREGWGWRLLPGLMRGTLVLMAVLGVGLIISGVMVVT